MDSRTSRRRMASIGPSRSCWGTEPADSVQGRTSSPGNTPVSWHSATPILFELVSADVEPSIVRLRWHVAASTYTNAEVLRARTGEAWVSLGQPSADGPDGLEFEDRAPLAPGHYGYRLIVHRGGQSLVANET